MATLITGAAGFIGSRLAVRLLAQGEAVVGLDNLDPYYDLVVKEHNIAAASDAAQHSGALYHFVQGDIRSADDLAQAFSRADITRVAHMAAMSGVRYSAERGALYAEVNIIGGIRVLEAARRAGVSVVVQASTSNVYGDAARLPFHEDDPAASPLSPYPASKRAAELFAHSYHHLHGQHISVLRFFNVYGPNGRPDMMPLKVIDAILRDQPITVYGDGGILRDWTYIDDILDGVAAALERPLGFRIMNLGYGQPIALTEFIRIYERLIGKQARLEHVPMPNTEPPVTFCDNTRARDLLGFAPKVGIEEGLARTWAWYRDTKL
jgi:UDP-glucuronate 4-epimerase